MDSIMSEYTPDSIESLNQNVVLIPTDNAETVALVNEDIARSGVANIGEVNVLGYSIPKPQQELGSQPVEKTADDYVFQFYMGSLTVVGLLILFRFIQKT